MDMLITILGVVAGVLAVVAGVLPLIKHEKPKDDNTLKETDKPNKTE